MLLFIGFIQALLLISIRAWQRFTVQFELLKQNVLDSIFENFKRFREGLFIDYVKLGIICYFILAIVFLYVHLN